MFFEYWKKWLAIWASKRSSYELFTFADFCWYAIFDWSSTNQMKQLVTHFFHPKLEFFVLDFNVDHSKPMKLSFCHVLSWFANITNSKPKNLLLWQFVTKHIYNIMPIYNKNAQIHHKSQSKTPNLEVVRKGRKSWLECTCLSWKYSKEHITACVERKTYKQ